METSCKYSIKPNVGVNANRASIIRNNAGEPSNCSKMLAKMMQLKPGSFSKVSY